MFASNGAAGTAGWDVQTDNSGGLGFALGDFNGGTIGISTTAANAFPIGTVFNLIATYDGSGTPAGLHLYLNGNALSTTAISAYQTTSGTFTSAGAFAIAGLVNTNNTQSAQYGLDAGVASIRLYNTAISQSQVTAIYGLGAN